MTYKPPEPFRPGQPVRELRRPLNELVETVQHILTNFIQSGPGIFLNKHGSHIVISSRPSAPARSGSTVRYFSNTITRETTAPSLSEIKTGILGAYEPEDSPKPGDKIILTDLTLEDMVVGVYEVTDLDLEIESWLAIKIQAKPNDDPIYAVQIGPNRLF